MSRKKGGLVEDVSEHITHFVTMETFQTWRMGIKAMKVSDADQFD